jgi:hypothetical protein
MPNNTPNKIFKTINLGIIDKGFVMNMRTMKTNDVKTNLSLNPNT